MESFIEEYITSTDYEDVNEEILLKRRISPYATLRPGDLAALLKVHPSVPIGSLKAARSYGSSAHHQQFTTIFEGRRFVEEDSDEEKAPEEPVAEVVCRGEDHGHIPVEYTVNGLRHHELPVIGVCIDEKICAGFRYRVRRADAKEDDFFWRGQARTLQSIGMGYGRRLTFADDMKNQNECYFWSDNNPAGYAFSIQAVDLGQKFVICDEFETVVGEAIIERVHGPQSETRHVASKEMGIVKHVSVNLSCRVNYYQRHHHGLMELMVHEEEVTVSGVAVLVKKRSARAATLEAVQNVFLPRLGDCKLVPDSTLLIC